MINIFYKKVSKQKAIASGQFDPLEVIESLSRYSLPYRYPPIKTLLSESAETELKVGTPFPRAV